MDGKKPIKLLVVDDEKIFRNLLNRTFSGEGFQVELAPDGKSALEMVREGLFDIVITDLMMPQMGGMDLLQKVKAFSPTTVVIIITGYASLDSAMMAIRQGAYDYITKPFRIEQIIHTVTKAKDNLELIRQNRELIVRLEDAYHRIEELINGTEKLESDDDEGGELTDPKRKKILDSMYALKKYQAELAQLKLLSSNPPKNNLLSQIEEAAQLRDAGKISESEYRKIKTRLLET